MATGTNVAVVGNSTPALHAVGVTGGVGNGIVVVGGGGITASNLAGSGGVVTAQQGGTIDLGTGTVLTAASVGSSSDVLAVTLGPAAQVPTVVAHDLTVTATAARPYGAYAYNRGVVNLSGLTTITTIGSGAHGWGLVAASNGALTAENAMITMTSSAPGGQLTAVAAVAGGHTTVTGTTVVDLTGIAPRALIAQDPSSEVLVNDVSGTLTSTLASAMGAAAYSGGTATVTGNVGLTITGPSEAFGVYVFNGGEVNFLGSADLTVTSPASYGILVENGGNVTLRNGMIVVNGSTAIQSESTAPGTIAAITVEDSTLTSDGDGIVVRGGTLNLTFDNVDLTNASPVAAGEGDLFTGRLGVRAHNTWVDDEQRKVQLYAEVNWWHDFQDQSVVFSGVSEFDDGVPDDRFDVGGGLNMEIAADWSLWANAEYQFGADGYEGIEALGGIKFTW